MGLCDAYCNENGTRLLGPTRAILLLGDGTGTWRPVALPLLGDYDRYGAIDGVVPSANVDAIYRLGQEFTLRYRLKTGIHGLLRSMGNWGAEWNGECVWFALIDDRVYRACIATIEAGGKPGVAADLRQELEALSFRELLKRAFDDDPLSLLLYRNLDGSSQQALLPELIDFCLFRAWGTELREPSLHCQSQQAIGLGTLQSA
jgi:hypothetical protein